MGPLVQTDIRPSASPFAYGHKKLRELLGPMWFDVYADGDMLRTMVRANADLHAQDRQAMNEIRDCLNLETMPLGRLQQWRLLKLMERKMTSGRPTGGHVFYLPGVIRLPLIMNRVSDASLVLFDEIDYKIRGDEIIFKENPFENPKIAWEMTPECGENYRTAYVWAFRGEYDRAWLHDYHGHGLGFDGVTSRPISSEQYRRQLLAIRAVLKRPTLATLSEFVASFMGTPVIREPVEVVEGFQEGRTGLLMVTDRNVYQIPKNASVRLSEGDNAKQGDLITDDFEIVESCKHDSIVSKGAEIPLNGNFIVVKLNRYCRIDEELIRRVLPPGTILNIYRDW